MLGPERPLPSGGDPVRASREPQTFGGWRFQSKLKELGRLYLVSGDPQAVRAYFALIYNVAQLETTVGNQPVSRDELRTYLGELKVRANQNPTWSHIQKLVFVGLVELLEQELKVK